MAQYAIGLLIKGLPNPQDLTSSAPVLYTNALIDASTLPAPIPSGCVVLPWLDPSQGSVSGISISSDIREPVKGSAAISVRLIDVNDSLATLFARDPGFVDTSFWDCAVSTINAATTSLSVSGISGIVAPRVYWLEQEAVLVTSAIVTNSMDWALTLMRGACASSARVHRLNPASYGAFDSGAFDTMSLASRPQFEDFSFEAELYLMQIADGGVVQIVYTRSGYIDGRPESTGDGRWNISLGDNTSVVADHDFGEARENVSIKRAAQVITQGGAPDYYISPIQVTAPFIKLWLDGYEAERIFNEPLHQPGNNMPVESLVNVLSAKLTQDPLVRYLLKMKIGGYDYVYRATKLQWFPTSSNFQQDAYVAVFCTLEFAPQNSSIKDNPYISFTSGLSDSPRFGLNSGFTKAPYDYLQEDEEKIEVEFRVGIRDSVVKTFLRLIHSDDGSLTTDPTYDVIFGRIGAGMFTSEVNQGTIPANPYAVEESTTELLELDALLPQPFDFIITPKDTFKEWLGNACQLHTLLFGCMPSSGKLALRFWFTFVAPLSIPTLNPIVGADDLPALEKLQPLSQIKVDIGYSDIDLKPALPPFAIRSKGASQKNAGNTQSVRLWIKTNNINFAQFVISQVVWRLSQAFFRSLQGQPEYILTTTFLPGAVRTFGDFVDYEDSTALVPTPTGYGISGRYIVSGIDINLEDGRQRLRLLPDLISRTSSSAGKIAPALLITTIVSISGPITNKYRVECEVDSLAEASFDITTAHQGIWQELQNLSGRVRVLNVLDNNPITSSTLGQERRGYLEASAIVTDILHVAGVNTITIIIDASWLRGGAVAIGDLALAGNYIVLTDRRFAVSNVENVEISPIAFQYYDNGAGADFLKIAPNSSSPPFDAHFSEIST